MILCMFVASINVFFIHNFIYPSPVSVCLLTCRDKGLRILYPPGKCPKMLWKLGVHLQLTFPTGATPSAAMCQAQGRVW